MEAKCYALHRGVGVEATSRLISRLRHREFGFLVTTSHLDNYAYTELRDDQQPIIVVSGGDIARILTECGIGTKEAVVEWLEAHFPATPLTLHEQDDSAVPAVSRNISEPAP